MRLGRLFLLALPIAAAIAQPGLAADAPPTPFKYSPQKLSAATTKTTAKLYAQTCASCHGMSGQGAGNGLSLFGAKDPLASAAVIHFGRAEPPPLKTVMPAYGAMSILTPKEIGQLSAYIATFRPPWP